MNFENIESENYEFFDIAEFAAYLETGQSKGLESNKVHIIATISGFSDISEFSESLVQFGFSIENTFGKLLKISKSTERDRERETDKIYFYVFFDDRNNVPLFITKAKKSHEIPETLFSYINLTRQISNLWISPKTMKEIKDDLLEQYENVLITYFSAKRTPNTDIDARYRPGISRSVIYRGIDGRKTLEEMEYYYGVLPKILEINLPNGVDFRIDNKGIITLRSGEFGLIFTLLEHIISKVKPVQEAIGESGYKIIQVGKNQRFNNAVQTPWSIVMSSKIDKDDIPGIFKVLRSEEWNFTMLEEIHFNDSMLFTARLIDGYSGAKFDISTLGDKIVIYPVDETDIGSSMRFYEFILENVDQMATVG